MAEGSLFRDAGAAAADPTLTDPFLESVVASPPIAQRGVGRVIFVDLLRLLASFQMLHGHTIDALLDQELRQGDVFGAWSWQRGLVSVGFLFAAGIAFTLSTLTRMDSWKQNTTRVKKRWRRIAWLIFLGYSMHIPAEMFSSDPARAEASLNAFMMSDVLHCIGMSIAIMQVVTHFAKHPRVVVIIAATFSLLCFGLAPLADAVPYEGWYRPLANYLTHRGGSLFPLFPWSGFVWAGVACGAFVAPAGARTEAKVPPPRLAILTVGLFVAYFVAKVVPFSLVTAETTSQSVPSFALLKLAAVMAVVFVLSIIGLYVTRLPRLLQRLAGESLMLYWFHLMLLYGAGIGLGSTIGHTLGLGETLGAAAAVVLVSSLVGLGWGRFKSFKAAKLEAWRSA